MEIGLLLNYANIGLTLQNVKAVIEFAKMGLAFQTKEQFLSIVSLEENKKKDKKQDE